MKSVVTKRFLECLELIMSRGLCNSYRQFADSVDYFPQSLSEIRKGRRDVTIEVLRKAAMHYGLNATYLLTGNGEPLMRDEEKQGVRILQIVTDRDQNERIVHVPIPAQAGYVNAEESQEILPELPTFSLPDSKYQVGTYRSFDLSGDSMEPTFYEGDKVVCDYLESSKWAEHLRPAQVYVLVTNTSVLIKRLFFEVPRGDTLVLKSDNPLYPQQEIKLSSVREIWQVQTVISPFMNVALSDNVRLRREIQALRNIIHKSSS